MLRTARKPARLIRATLPASRISVPRPVYWRLGLGPVAAQIRALRSYYLTAYGLDPALALVQQVQEETRLGGRSLPIVGNVQTVS